MSLLRFALPVLAAASAVYARDGSSCTASGTQTIQNGGDATAIASCTTFSGNIAIATGVSDDIDFGSTLTKIDGDFSVVSNSNIQRIGGASLETISGELKLSDVSQLASLSFPKLDSADKITLNGLANLRDLGFDGQVSKCSQLDIQNTQLQNLNGLNFTQCDSINIANNNAISSVAMSLTNITTLILSFNNADVNVSFPQLESAQNITCRACGSIDISALSTLASGLMVLDSNVESLIAPNLTKINGALTIDRNANLKNVSFPQLTDVGKDLQIANNTKLANITGFPVLKNVGAALDLSGNLTQVSTPKLDYVKGVFNLQSTEDLGSDCDFYNDLESKGKVPKTKYVCQGKLKEAGTAGTSPSSGNKTSPATTMNVQSAYLGLAGLAAVLLV